MTLTKMNTPYYRPLMRTAATQPQTYHQGAAFAMPRTTGGFSAAMRSWLMALKRQGFVRYLDDQKPVCWSAPRRAPQR